MPIRFRCSECRGLMSISRRLAGTETVCPRCERPILVPELRATRGKGESAATTRKPAKDARPIRAEEDDDDEDEDDEDEEDEETTKSAKFMSDAIDMTAMVDVTFLLLIFFMVTATFAAQKVLETSAPEPDVEKAGGGISVVENAEDLSGLAVTVEIDAHDQMRVDDQPVAGLFELKQLLTNKLLTEQKTEVLIQAQYETTHGMVVAVTDAALDVGMQRVRRLSRREE